jgi:DNA-binding transcriptional ArsR family regulator
MKTKKALNALSALAQESRLAVFLLLLDNEDGLPAGDIARDLDIPLTTMSFHLSQLKNAGLIKAKKEGRFIIYSANKKRAKKLAAYITGKDKQVDQKYQL